MNQRAQNIKSEALSIMERLVRVRCPEAQKPTMAVLIEKANGIDNEAFWNAQDYAFSTNPLPDGMKAQQLFRAVKSA